MLISNCLTLHLQASECNGWPKIRILIDNDIIQEYEFNQATVTIDIHIDLLDGDHVLEIERYGKTDQNIVFVDGQILKDQVVVLEDMYVDGVKLPEMFKYDSKFCYNNLEFPSVLTWGPNGVWSWRFTTPLLTNIIDRKNAGLSSPSLVIPNLDNVTALLDQIEKFKKSLQ
jgi:hypothetical protein